MRRVLATAIAVASVALLVVYSEGWVHTRDVHKGASSKEDGDFSGAMIKAVPLPRTPKCGSRKNTSAITNGSTEAGIVCVADDAGVETRMFYWEVKVPAPRGILFYLGGGPGCDSSRTMFQMGPSMPSADGAISSNPNALAEVLNFNIFFLDQPAHAGYSWSPTPATQFNYSDAESSQIVAAAIIKINQQFPDLPVVIAGESYGTKTASLVAARLLKLQPNFPLRALCLDAVLLDRVAELKNWTGTFGRFLGASEAQALHGAGVDVMEDRAKELRDAGYDQKAADVIENMWETTVRLTGVKNQHYLDPDRRYLSDAEANPFDAQIKKHIASLKDALDLDLPTFHGCSGSIWMGFKDSRLKDATWSLKEVAEKGVRVLLLTAFWDGMATVEATTAWLETNFPGRCRFLHLDHPQLAQEALQTLASQSMVHVVVDGTGHVVAQGQPEIFNAAFRAFLADDVGQS